VRIGDFGGLGVVDNKFNVRLDVVDGNVIFAFGLQPKKSAVTKINVNKMPWFMLILSLIGNYSGQVYQAELLCADEPTIARSGQEIVCSTYHTAWWAVLDERQNHDI
jgi:hypothetical protein